MKNRSKRRAGQQAKLQPENAELSQQPYFRREDWTLFRNLQTLGQKAGVPIDMIPRVVVKELVDNALDATGSCEFGRVVDDDRHNTGTFFVADDGPGLPGTDEDIGNLFSVSRPLTSSKLIRLPTRGALGNGLRVVAGAVLAAGGDLVVKTGGRELRLRPRDSDGRTDVEVLGEWSGNGTEVYVGFGDALSIDDDELLFVWASVANSLTDAEATYKGRTSAYWYDSVSFYELLQAAGERTVRDLVMEFEGCSGRKAGQVAEAHKGHACESLDREEADALLRSMRWSSTKVSPRRLGRVGDGTNLDVDAYAKTTGTFTCKAIRGDLSAIIPFVVEAWVKPSPDSDSRAVVCVNRTPITSDVWFTAMKDKTCRGLCGCGLSSEAENTAMPIKVGRNRQFTFILNVTTPYMPFTSDGKAPNLRFVRDHLRQAMEKAARKAGRSSGKPAVSQKATILKALPQAMEQAGRGRRYTKRQLFYKTRPLVIEAIEVSPTYDWFGSVITDHEADIGHDLDGMDRDDRGWLYHPHLCEWIPLGTRSVASYQRPEWTFNKILFIEKEGHVRILVDDGWPERNDCALVTSKGFANRAVRDVLDLLGETDEPITCFAAHDADAYGTMIFQSLVEATRARPARTVHVVNLGLDPQEGLRLGLPVEPVIEKTNRRAAVADYLKADWAEWLQDNRIELDAMDTPDFIAWLDGKMADYEGKLVPPGEVLCQRMEERVRSVLRQREIDKAVREAQVDERVEELFAKVAPRLDAMNGELTDTIEARLLATPERHWASAVDEVADDVAKIRQE